MPTNPQSKAHLELSEMPSDTLAHINQLEVNRRTLWRELGLLAAEHGDGERWDEVATPVLEELRRIEGALSVAWEARRRE